VIDTVIFDWGGTLTPWAGVEQLDGWKAFAAAVHVDDEERAAALARTLLDAEDARWRAVRDDANAFTVAHVLADAAVDSGVDGQGAALEAYKEFWVQVTHIRPEAGPVLDELRDAGLAIGLLSSTSWPAAWHEEWLARDGLLDKFDACVWSSDLAYTKPHRTAFLAAMEAVGATEPATCVYVGDRPYDDVSGAKAVGMRAVLIPHSDIPAHQQVPVDVAPDGVIQDLRDLPALLETWGVRPIS
jgi:FMN hydrolase / 5-amino-6-(5-phospho-D-ribitylamino)uracil phosphatase